MNPQDKKLLFIMLPVIATVAISVYTVSTPRIMAYIETTVHQDQYEPNQKTIVIIPILTGYAYEKNGFYDFYEGKCGTECLTVPVNSIIKLQEQSSGNTISILSRLGYDFVNDWQLDQNLRADPDWLRQYPRVLVLHSEYVTQLIFDRLQDHPKVIYMSPNALYGQVEINGYSMTLLRGHGYQADNGFDWKYDNTHPYEYEKTCAEWKFIPISNGYQLNCNPEETVFRQFDMLKTLAKL